MNHISTKKRVIGIQAISNSLKEASSLKFSIILITERLAKFLLYLDQEESSEK